HVTLIDAFADIYDKYPEWDLKIIGEGPLRPTLEEQIRRLGLEDRVSLPGATQSIGSEYRNADLFVLPSRYESFGLATAEAMGYGLAAIGFADCPGTNELIQDGINGKLAPSTDRTTSLANTMAK